MKLSSINYTEYKNTSLEWSISDLSLGDVNLLVSRNAVGKSRTLSLINALAWNMINKPRVSLLQGQYDFLFDDNGIHYKYEVAIENQSVVSERYYKNEERMIDRHKDGSGTIYADGVQGEIKLGIPADELAITRRDSEQYQYLEPIQKWADTVHFYPFNTFLGAKAIGFNSSETTPLDIINKEAVISVFKHGQADYPVDYLDEIRADMGALDYAIDDIMIGAPRSIRIVKDMPLDVGVLRIKENHVYDYLDSLSISTGMFRCLSLLLQINYYLRVKKTACIMIDDIGEGLDFERSGTLVKMLIAKCKASGVQLIMSTNDRFIMNHVPLEYWTVLVRSSGGIRFYNYGNSQPQFDSFMSIGLNNFDFFAKGMMVANEEGS